MKLNRLIFVVLLLCLTLGLALALGCGDDDDDDDDNDDDGVLTADEAYAECVDYYVECAELPEEAAEPSCEFLNNADYDDLCQRDAVEDLLDCWDDNCEDYDQQVTDDCLTDYYDALNEC